MKRSTARQKRGGFTLLEALFAAMLIGLVVAALAASSSAFTMANGYGMDLSTAEFLIEEIRDMTATLPVIDPDTQTATFGPESGETVATYDDVDDFHNASFSPPLDITRAAISDLAVFTQQVTVENVNATDLTAVVGQHTSDFVRITVTILKNNVPLNSTSWIRARY
jgi:type II secretory pathway pseudopilin PulG